FTSSARPLRRMTPACRSSSHCPASRQTAPRAKANQQKRATPRLLNVGWAESSRPTIRDTFVGPRRLAHPTSSPRLRCVQLPPPHHHPAPLLRNLPLLRQPERRLPQQRLAQLGVQGALGDRLPPRRPPGQAVEVDQRVARRRFQPAREALGVRLPR